MIEWNWRDSATADDNAVPWIGKTIFYIKDEPAAKVSFKAKPHLIKIEATGLCRKHTTKPRTFAVCYSDSEFCPKADRRDSKYAIENARILEGVVSACQTGIESKCKNCCDDDDSLSCQFCKANIKTACPSASGLEFLADTGSEEDLISKGRITASQLDNC